MAQNRPAGDDGSEPVLAGRYRVGDVLGRGGMGEVRSGYDVKLRRRVAIKLLVGAPGADKTAVNKRIVRLLREARAVASLSHPNVVAIYDVGEDERTPFIVMELLEGGSLAALMDQGKYPTPDQALEWLEQIAGALAAAHRAGIVHRDIKPDNLLFDREGRVKLADFGIVKALEDPVPDAATLSSTAVELTGLGRMVGTPRYMSPEQLRGEAVDGRTDEFAFGLLAFELLAAKHPYDATPAVTTPQMVANGFFVVPRISERAPGLPAGVDELVARCLAAEPKDRVASMSEVREAIAAVRRAPSSPTFTSGAPITVASPQHVTSSAPRMAGPTVGDVDLRGPTIADGPEAAWLGAGPTETMHALTPAPLASRRMWWLVGTLALLVTVAALGITRVRALRRRDPPTITAPTVSVVSVAPPATSAPAALPSAAPPTTDATPLPSAVPTTAPRKASARPHAPPPAPSTPPASSSARLPPPSDEIPSIRK